MGYCARLCAGCLSFNISDDQIIKIMTIRKFLLLFTGFMLLLAAGPWVFQTYYPRTSPLVPNFWGLYIIFGALTFFILMTAGWIMRISNKASAQALLGSITIKLLFCMVLAFVYLSKYDVEPVKFLVSFFYLYFFHTVFEIYCLLRNLRNQNFK